MLLFNIRNDTRQVLQNFLRKCGRNGDEIQHLICRLDAAERIANFDVALALSFFNKLPKPRIRENWGRRTTTGEV